MRRRKRNGHREIKTELNQQNDRERGGRGKQVGGEREDVHTQAGRLCEEAAPPIQSSTIQSPITPFLVP